MFHFDFHELDVDEAQQQEVKHKAPQNTPWWCGKKARFIWEIEIIFLTNSKNLHWLNRFTSTKARAKYFYCLKKRFSSFPSIFDMETINQENKFLMSISSKSCCYIIKFLYLSSQDPFVTIDFQSYIIRAPLNFNTNNAKIESVFNATNVMFVRRRALTMLVMLW